MKLVHISELKARFGIPHHVQHIRKLVKQGKFPRPIRCGRLTTFDENEIDAFLESLRAQREVA